MDDVSQCARMLLRVARQQHTNENAGYESRDLFTVWSSFVVEEVLEEDLWELSVWLEDFIHA
jgi:hypothetical protein